VSSRQMVVALALIAGLTACASIRAPQATTSPTIDTGSRAAAPASAATSANTAPTEAAMPRLSAFEGQWQHGKPCENDFYRMDLVATSDGVEGRWAAYYDGWGLHTGNIRATPDGAFLRMETCQDQGEERRFADSRCPELTIWQGDRGLRIDPTSGALELVAPSLVHITRFERVTTPDPAPRSCTLVPSKETRP
jgi:hypothetical protein